MEVHRTTKGRALTKEIFPRQAGQITDELGRLTAAEEKQLGALCRKLGLADRAVQSLGLPWSALANWIWPLQ